MFYKLDFHAYTLKMLGFVCSFWFSKTFLYFRHFLPKFDQMKLPTSQKKLFVKIGSNLDQKWQNSKIVCKFENFEKNLKFWPYKNLNSIEIDCCTSKKSWLVKPPNFIKSHFFLVQKKKSKKRTVKSDQIFWKFQILVKKNYLWDQISISFISATSYANLILNI